MAPQESACHCSGVLIILTLAVLCSGVPAVRADHHMRDPSLVIYLFEQLFDVPGTNATDIIAAPPGGVFSTVKWGYLGVAEFPVRASMDPTAPVIGNSPAFFVPERNEPMLNLFLLKLITLDTERYKGTLFAVGDFRTAELQKSGVELAVSGGTGSFRDATGYIAVTVARSAEDHVTYKYSVYLSTCKLTPLMFD
ncbi:hypothetical protein R1flu_002288 [Riccia fluitans]|uniref:Dirigent protein n=1 Tax=Riccia fluitans TaxID=41844 RepID=A0ABD1Y5Y8_9MARC